MVLNLTKPLLWWGSDTLSRRVGGDKPRVLLLQLNQFTQEPIVLCVIDRGGIQHIIEVVVPFNLLSEFAGSEAHSLFCLTGFHKDQNIAHRTDVDSLPVRAFLL
jgi:hypothetical protein